MFNKEHEIDLGLFLEEVLNAPLDISYIAKKSLQLAYDRGWHYDYEFCDTDTLGRCLASINGLCYRLMEDIAFTLTKETLSDLKDELEFINSLYMGEIPEFAYV
jgi:hypothetical protein